MKLTFPTKKNNKKSLLRKSCLKKVHSLPYFTTFSNVNAVENLNVTRIVSHMKKKNTSFVVSFSLRMLPTKQTVQRTRPNLHHRRAAAAAAARHKKKNLFNPIRTRWSRYFRPVSGQDARCCSNGRFLPSQEGVHYATSFLARRVKT